MTGAEQRLVSLARKKNGILLLDGGLGTMLAQKGLDIGSCPEVFSLDEPEILMEIHRDYLAAGSDLIQTNTFGANPIKLSNYGLQERTKELNEAAVELARRARDEVDRMVLISASMGPTGKLLAPYGPLEYDEARAAFSRQASALAQAGADLINIETMMDLREAGCALAAAVEFELPVFVNLTFQPEGRTMMGDGVEDLITCAADGGAYGVGTNCSLEPERMLSIYAELTSARKRGLGCMLQPNLSRTADASPSPVEYAGYVLEAKKRWFEGRSPDTSPVLILGGCCGTTPEHIGRMSSFLAERGH